MADSSPLTVTPSTTSAINRQVLKVSPNAACSDVIQQMTGGSQGTRNSCAFIVDETETVIGIITERDIVSITAAQTDAKSFSKTPISAVMTTPVKTLEIEAFQDIFAVLFLFRRYRIRHLPIVDAQDRLIGVVTPASIRRVLKPANLLKMRRVADVMTTDVIQAPADVPVVFLAQLMAQHRVSCIVIVDTTVIEEDGEPAISPPVGIVTERDIVQFQALNLNLHKTTAATVMSTPLFLLDPQDSLWAAHQAMQTRKVRRLVVSWNWGRDIGIVTQTSLLRVFDPIEMCSIIDSLQQTANQLAAEAASKAT
ncbi:MAG: CBS domain-containing protein, partial [Cyanobacteria bacterium J06650_10]